MVFGLSPENKKSQLESFQAGFSKDLGRGRHGDDLALAMISWKQSVWGSSLV